MAQLTGAYITYDDALRREDLLDYISDVSPDENYLMTIAKTREAKQTLHEWGDYYTSRPTSVSADIEGNDPTFTDLTKATRKVNITQLILEPFAVTNTEIAVDKVNPKDAYAREMNYAMRRFKNKFEYAALRGTKASGSSGVARKTHGVRAFVADAGQYTVRNSGTSLSEDEFNGMERSSWDQTDEYVFNLVLTTGKRKQDVSKFTAGNTKNIDAEDKRLVRSVMVYEGDFGVHEIRAHKDAASNELLGIRKEKVGFAWLIRPHHIAIGISGSSKKGMIEGEGCVEYSGEKAAVLQTNYNLT